MFIRSYRTETVAECFLNPVIKIISDVCHGVIVPYLLCNVFNDVTIQ